MATAVFMSGRNTTLVTMQESAMSLWSMPHAHAHAISISVLLLVHRHYPALFANSLARLSILPEMIAISWLL